MITSVALGALLTARAVAATAGVGRRRLAVIDRLVVPVGVAFTILLIVRLVDLWLGNA